MDDDTRQTLDDLDETGLWLRLNAAKARLFRTRDLGEQIAIRGEIGELSSRIHKLRREAAREKEAKHGLTV